MLTFRIEQPVTIATDHAPQAFRYADNQDYGRAPVMSSTPASGTAPGYAPGYAAAPYPAYPAPYAYGYPYPDYGGGFGLYIGPSYGYYYGTGLLRRLSSPLDFLTGCVSFLPPLLLRYRVW